MRTKLVVVFASVGLLLAVAPVWAHHDSRRAHAQLVTSGDCCGTAVSVRVRMHCASTTSGCHSFQSSEVRGSSAEG